MWRSIMGYYSIFDLINNNMAGNNNTQTNDASLVESQKQETTKKINHFDYDTKQQLAIWQKYIDVLTQRAENSDCLFTSEEVKINNNMTIDIYMSMYNNTIDIKKLIGCEVSLMYDSDDITDSELSDDEKYDLSEKTVNDINNGEIDFDYIDKIGTLSKVKSDNRITVQLYPQYESKLKSGHFTIPATFFGKISNIGDIIQYKRLRYGMKQLSRQLEESDIFRALLFCRNKEIVSGLPPINTERWPITTFLSNSLNEQQKKAVLMAISTDDSISLIQGPPGTGKTTVIAEICYQNAIRGRRTLIASQSNLAIDNAMGRLIYSKEILPIREGNVSRVDEIGEKYIPANIVKTLMSGAVSLCQNKINSIEDISTEIYMMHAIGNEINAFYEFCYCYYNDFIVNAYYYVNNCLCDTFYRQKLLERHFKLYNSNKTYIDQAIAKNVSDKENDSHLYTTYKNRINSLIAQLEAFAPKQCISFDTIEDDTYINRYTYKYHIDELSEKLKELCISKPIFFRLIKRSEWNKSVTLLYNSLIHTRSVIIDQKNSLIDSASHERIDSSLQKKKYINNMIFAICTYIQKSEYINLQASIAQKTSIVKSQSNVLNDLIERETAIDHEAYQQNITVNELYNLTNIVLHADDEINSIYSLCNFAINSKTRISIINRISTLINDFKNVNIFDFSEAVKRCDISYLSGKYKNEENKISDKKHMLLLTAYRYIYKYNLIELEKFIKSEEKQKQIYRKKQDNIKAVLTDWCNDIKSFDDKMTEDLLDIIMKNVNVVSITCLQAAGKAFKEKYNDVAFDTVVIDEVSKSIPPELILPSTFGKSLVLIGDHKQLPPMIDTQTLDEIDSSVHDSLKESVFKTLFENIEPSHKIMLNEQYRMHSQIMNVINCFYNGSLICGLSHDEEEHAKAHNVSGNFIQKQNHVLWINTPNKGKFYEGKDGTSTFNDSEVILIDKVLKELNDNLTIDNSNVSIISFYSAQVNRIKENINKKAYKKLSIKTSTVDRFQGAESEIVIVSTVRNNSYKDIGFAKSFERINVAFSRAQKLLIIVGSAEMLTSSSNSASNSVYQKIFDTINNYNGIIAAERLL